MVLEIRAQDPGDLSAITRVARQLGVGTESLRTGSSRPRSTGHAGGPDDRGARRAQASCARRTESSAVERDLAVAAAFFGAELDRQHKR